MRMKIPMIAVSRYFSYFSMKIYVVSMQKFPNEVLLMDMHKVCFHGEIRKYQSFVAGVRYKVNLF